MKKLALMTTFILFAGCAAMEPMPQATVPATPSITVEDVQTAVDDALVKAFAANDHNAVDVQTTIHQAVEKAVARTVNEMQSVKATSDQAVEEAKPLVNGQQPVEKVSITRPHTTHRTLTLKREIRDCALELLMYDTHVADATDACLRIYRSQYRRQPPRADDRVLTTRVSQ